MVKELLQFQEHFILIWEVKCMKVLGNKIKCVDMVYINMLMVHFIVEIGKIINIMEKDNMNFQMEHVMLEIGKII